MEFTDLKDMPDITGELLQGFSPFLAGVSFDFEKSTLVFCFVDDPERCSRIRRLTFERLHELQVTSLELDDEFMDSVIGIHHQADAYFFRTERFEISFRCDRFLAQ